MAIKHKHMSETVDDMTTGWRRILIGSGFFCLSVMMLWWWYCAIRATSPQMIDIDVSGNNRYSTILLVVLLVFIVAVSVFAKVRQAVRGIWHMMVRYKWILFVIVICWQIVMFFALGPATGFDAEWVIDYVVNPQVITDKGLDGASYLSNSPNNYLLFFVELGIYKALPFVTSLEALLLVMRVISVLVVDVCAIGMYAVAKRYLNDSVANIVLLLWCILLGLSGWCLHPYSDTFCMPFTVINCAFCFWLLSQKTIDKAFLSSWKNPVLIFLFGLNLAVTYNLKPSAVIPVIALFAGAFFADAWWVSATMYLVGIVLVLLGALLVKKITGQKYRKSFFIIELPEYKIPSLKRACVSMLERGKAYIVKAGTIILVCNTVVQIMQSFNWQFQLVEEGAESTSILASIAHPFAILFIPLGFGVWQLAAAAITGFIAKENVVATLAVVYGVTNLIDPDEMALVGSGNEVATIMGLTKAAALAYLMFNLYTPPCFAALGAMNSEMKSGKWLFGGICLQLATGYTVAFLVYQIGTLATTGALGTAFVPGLIAILVFAAIIIWRIRRSDKEFTAEYSLHAKA